MPSAHFFHPVDSTALMQRFALYAVRQKNASLLKHKRTFIVTEFLLVSAARVLQPAPGAENLFESNF